MDPVWLLLLLPLAAASGWYMAVRDGVTTHTQKKIPDAYFKGLSCLLNEQPDEALKIFLEVVKVDSETVELHMALGNLFRLRGEIDRATRIHQNLVARSDLDEEFRSLALFELAQDYFRAGLYDRAENLFQELSRFKKYTERANRFLLQIYDQEKEWGKAVVIAVDLHKNTETDHTQTIAHLYCELAERSIATGDNQKAETYIESAFRFDQKCIRAVMQSGRLASMRGNHTNAIAIWRGLEFWSPTSLGEVVGHITNSYKALNDHKSLRRFLEAALIKNPDPRIINALVELTREEKGVDASQELLLELVRKFPSLESVHKLITAKSSETGSSRQNRDYSLLAGLLSQVVQTGRNYHCRHCGFQSNSLHWQCPGCKKWGTVQRQQVPALSVVQQSSDYSA